MAKQWTRNYDNLFSTAFGMDLFGGNQQYVSTPSHNVPHFRKTDGGYMKPQCAYEFCRAIISHGATIPKPSTYGTADYKPSGESTNSASVLIGCGTTTPTKEDFNLEMSLTSNVSMGAVSATNAYDEATHIYTKTYKIPILYSGADPVTIGEFGIFVGVPYNGSNQTKVLVYRETLETPVTLEQNDTFEITFSQSFMQPNYSDYPTAE